MDKVRELVETQIKVSDEDWDVIRKKITLVEYKKKDIILKEGETENYVSLVETGIARLFLPKENSERTVKFAFEKEFLTSYTSFHTRKPSQYATEALTDVVLWRVSYLDMQEIYKTSFLANVLGRKFVEMMLLQRLDREFLQMNYTAEEKYRFLVQEYPHYIQLIAGKHLASFIGITPQALSRIRSRIY